MASNGQRTLWKFSSGEESVESNEQGFKNETSTGYGPAPQIIPPSGNFSTVPSSNMNPSKTPIGKFEDIDVVKHFPWTYSPRSSRDEVPELILKEERILQNPIFNTMAYNMFTATDMLPAMKRAADEKDANGGGQSWIGGTMKTLTSGLSEDTQKLIGQFTTSVKQMVENVVKDETDPSSLGNFGTDGYRRHLEPYQRLYSTFPTGFRYHFPYFTDEFKSNRPSFTDSVSGQSQLPLQEFIAKGANLAGSIANSLNAAKSGTFIEHPKYPAFPADSKYYSITFPLLNTVSYEATYKNWQLLFLLLYQNLPNRINRSVILPPKIYEATIPGVWYSRYSYISSISVKMLGTRRKLRFDNTSALGAGMDSIETVVPDAYEVSITMSELISESQNYMFESIMRNTRVRVSERGAGVSSRDSINVQSDFNNVVSSGTNLGRGLLGN